MNISIAIMAAGFGTRMKSKTPKVLHKISGFEILYYIIKEAQKVSDDITVILYHEANQIQQKMDEYFTNINYIIQNHDQFPGTGGAIMDVHPKYEKLLVLNGDMPLLEAKDMLLFAQEEAPVIMSSFCAKDASGYGRVIKDNTNLVEKIVEEKDANEQEKKIKDVNAGVYLFDSDFLQTNLPKLTNDNQQNEYYITDLIKIANDQLIPVKAIDVDEETFMGVNSKYHLALAETCMQARIKKRFMEAGVIMRLPETIYIEAEVQISGESVIENGVSLLGHSNIIDSIVKTNSVVEDSTLEDSDIGPMARIRPGSYLFKTHIGNFVEVKKSTLKGVKAGHLSYLGDSSIDEGTNIGCGTITCNYDGKSKFKTIIGKNVFIGSDTQLVAPVTIEDDVMIAAGTTVTKNVKQGSLAINRHPLKIIDNFFYKFFGKK
ncbi:bifunctional UDP-N-acetylglucosamine diphosphorylase/glucosamine-1-phosphate N-acetyltransferase GlmU [Sulfurospirillum sp. 1612]|uniref:bifunctional UDP-N-acetylglucosamine diphosphorylase/glucosamine-1-phosphate N-acetyltransferase GlmU n=1 Tax=Sulfurospirillum sp. 1612 TaxID=3094835 RepID=UPI002F93CB48